MIKVLLCCLWRRGVQLGLGTAFRCCRLPGEKHIPFGFPQLLLTLCPSSSLTLLRHPARGRLCLPLLRASAPLPSTCSVRFLFSPSLLPSPTPPCPSLFFSSSFLLLVLELGDRQVCRLPYQAFILVCGCPRPWVVKNTVFLSALLCILAAFQSVQPMAQPLSEAPPLPAAQSSQLILCFFL